MIKTELSELKKRFTQKNCSITRIAGCYVDGDKSKKGVFSKSFLGLPEEEQFKYFELFRKALSGTPGKTAIDLVFAEEGEKEGGAGEFMLRLRESELKDEALLEEYFDRIISSYEYVGNYLILAVHDAYDVPGKASEGGDMDDASDEVYEYVFTVLCPVNLSEPGLSYDPATEEFHNRTRDWVVDKPAKGFLFPSFNMRTSDIHGMMYYSKDAENIDETFIDYVLNCTLPMTAGTQKQTFSAIVEETLGDKCGLEAVKNIHEKMGELLEEHKEEPEPLVLERTDMRRLMESVGAPNDRMKDFDSHYEVAAGDSAPIMATNIYNPRSFDVKTPDVVIKVKPDRTDLIDEKTIDGRACVVVELNGEVEVNGINVRARAGRGNDNE